MIACVMIPYFAIMVERQHDPALAGVPLMLVKYGAKRSQIAAMSIEAVQAGVVPGMALSRARGLCPNAHLLSWDETRLKTACDHLLKILWDYTNRVEVDETAYPQTGVFYLDLGSLRDADAQYLGEHLQTAMRQQFKTEVAVGLASGKFPAYVAAMSHPAQVKLVPRHQEGELVAPQPVSLLPLSKNTARKLNILCIREIGQFARLPREAVMGQFGREGRLLYALAQGLDGRPVKPRQMPASETVNRQLDEPLRDRNRLDVVIHHLADALSQRLEQRSSALHAVTLTVHLETGKTRVEQLHLLQPMIGAKGIARTIQQLLERIKLTQGITGLEICAAHLVPNLPQQLELFTHKPGRSELIDLVRVLAVRHGECFYEVTSTETTSLLPERRFRLLKVDIS